MAGFKIGEKLAGTKQNKIQLYRVATRKDIPTGKAVKVSKRGAAHASHTRLEFYSETLERQEVVTDRLGYWGNKKKKKKLSPTKFKNLSKSHESFSEGDENDGD